MSAANYPVALAWALAREGGYVNAQADHGGPTNHGITEATLAAYRGHAVTVDDVRNIPDADVAAIYRAGYWDTIRGDELPAGVDLSAFDCAVMSGPKRAIQWLQYAVCAAPDGVLGPHTMDAVAHAAPEAVVASIAALRIAFYRGIVARDASQSVFLAGWISRANLTKVKALTMCATVGV